jgi:hypothetical protein
MTPLTQLDPRQQVLLHGTNVIAALTAAGATPSTSFEPFRPVPVAVRTANRIVLEVELERPGILILNEPFFPGWRALDGDAELPVLRANVLFRALALGVGDHRIALEFSPVAWRLGWWISVAAAVVTAGLGARAAYASLRSALLP